MSMTRNALSQRSIKDFARLILQVLLLLGLSGIGTGLASEPVAVGFIAGGVFVLTGETPGPNVPLTKGTSLHPRQTIQTGPEGTAEMFFPAAVILRLGPSGSIRLSADEGKQDEKNPIPAMLLTGEIWVNASASKPEKPFAIATETCLLETGNGVFRVIRHSDGASEIKAYGGRLKVSRLPKPGAASPAGKKWEQELHPYTKMVVWPDGRVTKPFRFAAKADQTEWVLWNLERDKSQGRLP